MLQEDVMRMARATRVGVVAAAKAEAEIEATVGGETEGSNERRYAADDEQQKHVSVLEVLTDRHGPRAGRWGAFTIEKGKKLCSISLN